MATGFVAYHADDAGFAIRIMESALHGANSGLQSADVLGVLI